jgi:hypothetical protein
MATLKQYMARIATNDRDLTEIYLISRGLNNADASRLMEALSNAPDIANNITIINLSSNRLTQITIPAQLTALTELDLSDNQLTAINIPAQLTALELLRLDHNGLAIINIPAQLTALRFMNLVYNTLTAATKLALYALVTTRPAPQINIEEYILEQLTPKMLDNHLHTITSTYLSIISSQTFKDNVLDLYYLYSGLQHNGRQIPVDVMSHILGFMIENNPQKLLLENIAMLRSCFANHEIETGIFNSWLASLETKNIITMVNQKQCTKINKLLKMYDRKFLDMHKMPGKREMVASSVATLTWQHKPSYGLSDNTPIDPKQNPLQLAFKPKI